MSIQLSSPSLPHTAPIKTPRIMPEHVGLSGLRSAAKVATPQGWKAVSALKIGDKVETIEGTTDHIVQIERFDMSHDDHVARPATWHMFFPAGAIGNKSEVIVSAKQAMLLQSEAVAEACGAPRGLFKASDFFGRFGAYRVIPEAALSLTVLSCSKASVLIGKEGILYFCAGLDNEPLPAGRKFSASPYPTLSNNKAAEIIEASATRFHPFDLHHCLTHNFALRDSDGDAVNHIIGL